MAEDIPPPSKAAPPTNGHADLATAELTALPAAEVDLIALKALYKAKTSTLDFADATHSYLMTYKISQAALSAKLGAMPSFISEVLNLVMLTDLEKQENKGWLGPRKIRELCERLRSRESLERPDEGTVKGVEDPLKTLKKGVEGVEDHVRDIEDRVEGVEEPLKTLKTGVEGVEESVEDVEYRVEDQNKRVESHQTADSGGIGRSAAKLLIYAIFGLASWFAFIAGREVRDQVMDLRDRVWGSIQSSEFRVPLKGFRTLVLWGFAAFGVWQAERLLEPKIRHGFRSITVLFHTGSQSPDVGTPLKPASVAAPVVTGFRLIAGNRLELRWTLGAPGTIYRIYYAWHGGDLETQLGDVATPGAIIEAQYEAGRGVVTVTAIAPNNEESPRSLEIGYAPTPLNVHNRVEPLPLEGTAKPVPSSEFRAAPEFVRGTGFPTENQGGARVPNSASKRPSNPQLGTRNPERPTAASPSALPLLSPPAEVHSKVLNPDLIVLSWRAVGKDIHYNVYSSASREIINPRKENEQPLKNNAVEWTPETGLDRYWIVVTALDAQGHESLYSEAIEVIRREEKSGSGGLEDAAGAIRKVLPW